VIRDDARVMAVRDAGKTHAELACDRDAFTHRQLASRKRQPPLRIDQQRRAMAPCHGRHRGAIRAAIAQMRCVLRHAAEAMRRQALGLREHERSSRARGHRFACARRTQSARCQLDGFVEPQARHQADS
jgi:hypothetical protein